MSTNKAALKAAKTALDAGEYDQAVTQAQIVLASDSSNYFARLFLGRAFEKQGKPDDAAKTYEAAAKSKPDDAQAWLGLCSLYETQGSAKVDEYRDAAVKVAQVYAAADDKHKCQSTIDKLQGFFKENGTKAQQKRALQVLLPDGPVYEYLEGRIQHPSLTYTRICEITETEDDQQIKQSINERRTRIGARIGQVTVEVKREVFRESDLEDLYRQVIDWTSDDEARRQYEEKLLQRAYDTLVVLPLDSKGGKLDQVLNMAEGMVIIKHEFELAWNLVLETRDMDELRGLDVNVLREYVALFPDGGLAKVMNGWLSSELSPFPPPPKDESTNGNEPMKALTPEALLVLFTEGLTAAEDSPLAHRLVSEYFLHLEEYESVVETARNGLKVVASESNKLGMRLQNTIDAINSALATSLVHHQAPRNHAEARRLFEDILSRRPKSTPGLIGMGLILEEREEYTEAINFFTQAMAEDSSNVRIGTELAWCKYQAGDHEQALRELEQHLPSMKADDPQTRDLRAQTLYRIGMCIWSLNPTKEARKARNGAYARFLSAIKANVNFAPAYASLGIYYADYAKDKKRARQCFQKAFELSSAETEAAERLARSFADRGEWEIVEVIAQRIIDSGRARPPPGSKRKGISWPYSALGVVQMNKQEYQQAIVSFLSALRISPDDYQSYVGLGESYHNSGRYNSALRTFTHALEPPEGTAMKISGETWFARYMLANVHRELGEYGEAGAGLRAVLEEKPGEFGVLISLMQTYVEEGFHCLETGLFGRATEAAEAVITTAYDCAQDRAGAFNLWKAAGDAFSIYAMVGSKAEAWPEKLTEKLFSKGHEWKFDEHMTELDGVTSHQEKGEDESEQAIQRKKTTDALSVGLSACVFSYKQAIVCCADDVHAQAVAYYNLGWAENTAYISTSVTSPKESKKFLRAAVRCFKRAIELEAGNAEFWNALGVVTTTLNPKIAQHAFVRSLHLNELNAKVWTNLGALYLLQDDHELAHQAFGRAQSTDPDYAHAWVGEGLIALLLDDTKEALGNFTHAFEISDSASLISKRQYTLSSFDHLVSSSESSNDVTYLLQPLFALEQLRTQNPRDLPYRHLAALLLERVRSYPTAIETLTDLCTKAEADYESTESLSALARFAHAKADLARIQLAAHEFDNAITNAETALDLSSDAESSGLDPETRQKLRLSAHLTLGMASHYTSNSSTAITAFKTALQESSSDPDVVCLLVQVLWSTGGSEEKAVARDQLFSSVEQRPEHVASVTLLGAIARLEDDVDTAAAVRDDLLSLRTLEGVDAAARAQIAGLLAALSERPVETAQEEVLLRSYEPGAWRALAEAAALIDCSAEEDGENGEQHAREMVLETSLKCVPPMGGLEADELAGAFAGTGSAADAQIAIALAPWERAGWESLGEAVGR